MWRSSAVTHAATLPFLPAAVSSLRLIQGWWQGAAPGDLKGVMKGASGQEPQEGGLLVVLPCYLCRGHGGSSSPAHACELTHLDSCSSLNSLFALGRKMGREKQTVGSVCPGAHHTPSISELPLSPFAGKTQSFPPLLSLLRSVLLSIPSGVLVQSRSSADIIL